MAIYPSNLTNLSLGRLIPLSHAGRDKYGDLWLCRCVCDGNERVYRRGNLISGNTRSCGCIQKEWAKKKGLANAKHGQNRKGKTTSEYYAWRGAKARCNNPTDAAYSYYGGRGVQFCTRWLNSFENFFADMGPKPSSGHSLDRINTNGNYEPDNCRWATDGEQMKNRRSFKCVEQFSTDVLVKELSRRHPNLNLLLSHLVSGGIQTVPQIV